MTKIGSYSIALFLLILAGCSGGKNVSTDKDLKELMTIQGPYYQQIFPGTQDGVKTMILFFPCNDTLVDFTPDSVYFKGFHEPLKPYMSGEGMGYRARIQMTDNYKTVAPPVSTKEDEAVISLLFKDGKKTYMKVGKVAEGESIFMP